MTAPENRPQQWNSSEDDVNIYAGYLIRQNMNDSQFY
jgi:hypothetical protein